MDHTILIIGATGATGRATAAVLARRGVPFRATSRKENAEVQGGDMLRCDLDDSASVRRALEGAQVVFLVTPSSERAERQQLRIIDEARAAGVTHLVLLSQFAAAVDSPVRFLRYHARVEAHLAVSGIPATVLRPNLFMQGLFALREQLAAGVLPAPVGDAPVSAIDVRDIGEVAAVALTGAPMGTLTLTGPQAITHATMAELIGRATGRSVRFVDVTPADFAAALRGQLPDWQVDGLVEDYAHYAAGEASDVSADIHRVLGRDARSFAEFVTDFAQALY